jgi:hypothetical protein
VIKTTLCADVGTSIADQDARKPDPLQTFYIFDFDLIHFLYICQGPGWARKEGYGKTYPSEK